MAALLLLTFNLMFLPLDVIADKYFVVTGYSPEEQKKKILQSMNECFKRMNETKRPTDGLYCDMVFDNVMCWNYIPAGQLATQHCPDYISGFYTGGFAGRTCLSSGEWLIHPDVNKSWTNFSGCDSSGMQGESHHGVPDVITDHIHIIQLLSRIGYSISLAFLLFAVFIMLYFKKLHCQRNAIHVNLFMSCILRAGVCLLKEFIFVQSLGLPIDIEYDQFGKPRFIEEGTHWQCKLLFTVFHYSLCTNYIWVFVEGLYLNNLIFFTVFSQKRLYLILYILLGWLSPLLIILPWVVVRVLKENTLCWNTHDSHYYWIVRGPIIASICISFFFFLNIIRVLFTKLMTSLTREPQRYRKLAKSTLVLIPLFGVQYILFIILIYFEKKPHIEAFLLYPETFLNAFQGAIVTIIFCFLNGEVKTEIRKFWNHYMFRGRHSFSRPSSRNFNTTSSFVARDRAGSDYNQSVVMVDLNRNGSSKTSPVHNGDPVSKNCNGSANGDLNTINTASENTSLLKTTAQEGQLSHTNSPLDKQLLPSSESVRLLANDVNFNLT